MTASRVSNIFRTLATTLGAYGLTALWTVTLSHILARAGVLPVEAVVAATMPSFAIFAVIAMMAFHARSPARAWIWLAVAAAAAVPLLLV